MLPLIDLNPSDESCIYLTLNHIIDQAKCLNIEIPCVNFNQLLWIKAFEIVKTKSLRIVLRLAGFHNLMSFVGSVGFSMEGSGLEKVFETDYGKKIQLCFLERPSPRHLAFISLSIQLFG